MVKMNVRIVDGNRDYLKCLDSFKLDYQKPNFLKKDLMEKYNLTYSEFDKLSKIVRDELNFEKRGIHTKYSKYDKFWDIKKVYFLKEQYKEGRIRKCFFLKYKNKTLKIGGFIDPLSCELIYDIISNEV